MTHTCCFITLKPRNKCYNGNNADTLITAALIRRRREGGVPVGSVDDDDYYTRNYEGHSRKATTL
jgi:hypothetical protein